ncbi:hypothetical protein B0T10DRAFT_601107 [Thelonectria olida]|uniref:BTB domain-containing protein n=1 Tax=Thelonectria olida TaxID=1576542 RepID=A0A9P8WFD9_9HYPO|nr:hypothetical protein B0T10DRAFT_601107 [Thelonectria olida]
MADNEGLSPDLAAVLLDLLQTGKNTDFALLSHGKKIHLHKLIVCAQSPVIDAALNGSFKESKTAVLRVDDSFSFETVQYMTKFLYTGKYEIETKAPGKTTKRKRPQVGPISTASSSSLADSTNISSSGPTERQLLFQHYHVCLIADYYDIPNLKSLAIKVFSSTLGLKWTPSNLIEATCEILEATSDEALTDSLAVSIASRLKSFTECTGFEKLEDNAVFLAMVLKKSAMVIQDKNLQLENAILSLENAENWQNCLNRGDAICCKCLYNEGSRIVKEEVDGSSSLPFEYSLLCTGCYKGSDESF